MTPTDWIHPDATGEFVQQSQLAASAGALGTTSWRQAQSCGAHICHFKKKGRKKRGKEGARFPANAPNLRTVRLPAPGPMSMFTPSPISMCATPPGMRTPPNAGVPRSTRSKSNPVTSTSDPNDASTHALTRSRTRKCGATTAHAKSAPNAPAYRRQVRHQLSNEKNFTHASSAPGPVRLGAALVNVRVLAGRCICLCGGPG